MSLTDYEDLLGDEVKPVVSVKSIDPTKPRRPRGRPRKDTNHVDSVEDRLRRTMKSGSKKKAYTREELALIDRWIDESKGADLPDRFRETYWNAKIKEMKFRVLAGELWPTETVMEVLADTFQILSGKTKLWVDDIDEVNFLSVEQRRLLQSMVDDLLAEMRKGLLERAETKVSESYVAELDA